MRGDAGPALVEQVDGNPRLLGECACERPGGFGLRSRTAAHVQRKTDHGGADAAFAHQLGERREIGALRAPLQRSRRKCDAAVFIGDGEADPSRSEIDAEHPHGAQRSRCDHVSSA